mmetsp:Transcript_55915/g.109444  ORF Transcript_55915/g.109444 Transcript_55915/m.109444 type:complete len:140 (+) Transcript_55915:912-1331(+)
MQRSSVVDLQEGAQKKRGSRREERREGSSTRVGEGVPAAFLSCLSLFGSFGRGGARREGVGHCLSVLPTFSEKEEKKERAKKQQPERFAGSEGTEGRWLAAHIKRNLERIRISPPSFHHAHNTLPVWHFLMHGFFWGWS